MLCVSYILSLLVRFHKLMPSDVINVVTIMWFDRNTRLREYTVKDGIQEHFVQDQQLIFYMPKKYLEWKILLCIRKFSNFQRLNIVLWIQRFLWHVQRRVYWWHNAWNSKAEFFNKVAYTFEASQHACNSILVPHWHYRFSQGEHSEAMEDARCVLEMKAKKL